MVQAWHLKSIKLNCSSVKNDFLRLYKECSISKIAHRNKLDRSEGVRGIFLRREGENYIMREIFSRGIKDRRI